jgi:hypothetical protein
VATMPKVLKEISESNEASDQWVSHIWVCIPLTLSFCGEWAIFKQTAGGNLRKLLVWIYRLKIPFIFQVKMSHGNSDIGHHWTMFLEVFWRGSNGQGAWGD